MGLDFLDTSQADFENALLQTKFGKFHIYITLACGLIYMNTAMGITLLSFVLPAATCDFNMGSQHKAWMNASPMLGMIFGSFFWGCLADTKGRKIVLVLTLLGDGLFGLASSVTPWFIAFLVLRFFNGFNIAGAMSICFPYLGEFLPSIHREKILCWMELFWTLGIILLPLIAWGTIPFTEINFQYNEFFFHSWNVFVMVCSLPSIILGCWLFAFPESPKFHYEIGETDKALHILQHMYAVNTRNAPEDFPVKTLKGAEKAESEQRLYGDRTVRQLRIRRPRELALLLKEIWTQTKNLCKKPHLRNTALTCFIQFGLTMSYYTLMLWFPELMQRYEMYEEHHGKDVEASVCDVNNVTDTNNCDGDGVKIDSQVFLHVLYIGFACIPGSFLLPLCVHRVGVKMFLVLGLCAAAVVTIGLYFIRNSIENMLISCFFEALTSLSISVVYVVMVDLFPTNLRVMAAALSMMFGRIGGLIGNLIFGTLLDTNCVFSIILFALLLLVSGLMCLLIPDTSQMNH